MKTNTLKLALVAAFFFVLSVVSSAQVSTGPLRPLRGAEKIFGAGWCPCAGVFWGFDQQQTVTTAGTAQYTYRRKYRNMTGKKLDSVRLVFANSYSSGTAEASNGFGIYIWATVQRAHSTAATATLKRYDALWTGQVRVLIEDGGIAVSDPIPISIEKDGVFYVFSAGSADTSTTGKYSYGGSVNGGTQDWSKNNGEGVVSGLNTRDGSTSSWNDNNGGSYALGPAVILGHCRDNIAVNSVFAIGDSITAGAKDYYYGRNNYGGWLARKCGGLATTGGTPFTNAACSGWKALNCSANDGLKCHMKLAVFFSHAVVALGRNDIADTLANIKSYNQTIVTQLRWLGLHVGICPIIPGSMSSTDGYQTVANQTPDNNSNRTGWNSHLRDTTSTGFCALSDKVFTDLGYTAANFGSCTLLDTCASLECNSSGVLTANGGYVIAPSSISTITGDVGSTTQNLVFSGNSWTWNQFMGYAAYYTAGSGTKFGDVRCNGTASVTPVNTIVIESAMTTSMASGAVKIYPGMMSADNLHPLSAGHQKMADGISNWTQWIRKAAA